MVAAVALVQHRAAGAQTVGGAAAPACLSSFSARIVGGDPNAAVVGIVDPPEPFTGTITAYGADRKWSGPIGRSVTIEQPWGHVTEITVRADGRIEGVEYAPSWSGCTFRAPMTSAYAQQDLDRPVLTLGSAQPLESAGCARPYAPARVLHAFEPQTPVEAYAERVQGTVYVEVALDEAGVPRSTRIVSSPSTLLNQSAANAAKLSRYSPAVFRCKPVPSDYTFAVDYSSQ